MTDNLFQAAREAAGNGPLLGKESEDLNWTLLHWQPGKGVSPHVNEELDVLMIVVSGTGTLTIDDDEKMLAPGDAVLIPKGANRAIVAVEPLTYLNVHRRRRKLQIQQQPPRHKT